MNVLEGVKEMTENIEARQGANRDEINMACDVASLILLTCGIILIVGLYWA
jgi:hypothetical protein